VNLKKFIGILAIALVIFAIITAPAATATFFGNIGEWLANAADAVIRFFTQLF